MGRSIALSLALSIALSAGAACRPVTTPAPAPARPDSDAVDAPSIAAAPEVAFFPVPPLQHRAPDELRQAPADLVSGLAALHEAGLPDPRGCEYRRVAVDEALAPRSPSDAWALELDLDGRAHFNAFVLPGEHRGQRFAVAWDGNLYPLHGVGEPVELPTYQPTLWVDSDLLMELALLVRLGEEARAAGVLTLLSSSGSFGDPEGPEQALGTLLPRAVASRWASAQLDYALRAFEARSDRLASAVAEQAAETQLRLEARLANERLQVDWCEGRSPWCGWDDLQRLADELDRRREGDPSATLAERPADQLSVDELIELWEVEPKRSREGLAALSMDHMPQVLAIVHDDRRVLRGADPSFVERTAYQLGNRILMRDGRLSSIDPFDRGTAYSELAGEAKALESLSPAGRIARRLADDAGADRGWKAPVQAFIELGLAFDGSDPEHNEVSRHLGDRATELGDEGCGLLEALAAWDPAAARAHPRLRAGGLATVDTTLDGLILAGCVTEIRASIGDETAAAAYASYFRRVELPPADPERDSVDLDYLVPLAWRPLLAREAAEVASTIRWAFTDRASPWRELLRDNAGLDPFEEIVDVARFAVRKESGVDLFRAPAFRARIRKELTRCGSLSDEERVALGIRGHSYESPGHEQWVKRRESGILIASQDVRRCDALAYLWTASGYEFDLSWPVPCRDRAIASLRKSLRDPDAEHPAPPSCAPAH